jgi:hypothetical protein
MQRSHILLASTVLILSMTACGHHLTNTPNATSLIVIATTGPNPQPVSAPNDKASITMNIGEQRHYTIQRSVTKGGVTTTGDATANSDYNFTNPSVASMDSSGTLTALAPGFTTLTVIFRDADNDDSDNDKVAMDITVLPAP